VTLKQRRKLIRKYLAGGASQEEIKQIDDWYHAFETEEHDITTVPDFVAHQAKQRILEKIAPSRGLLHQKRIYGYAAACIAVLFICLLISRPDQSHSHEQWVRINTYGKGDTSFLTPDHSRIWLQANSELSYNPEEFGKRSRVVKLNKGQAYFEVKKNPSSPFSVLYQQTAIQVLGTGFNVSTNEKTGRFNVMVSHGLVSVSHQHKRLSRLKNGETITLNTLNGNYDTGQFNAKYAALWREQEISLHEASFEELSEVFFSVYQMRLQSADVAAQKYTYTLVINKKDNYLSTLDIITSIHQNKFKLKKDTILIY